jgi:hypothetical protein
VQDLTYFSHHPKGTNITLIGTDKEQIFSTLRHYKLPLPSDDNIHKLARVTIFCALDFNLPTHSFKAEVLDGVSFEVHATAFEYIKKTAEDFDNLKRGDLYKFDTGLKEYGLLFLPEYIMQGIKDYDWNQHKEEVDKWMKSEQMVQPKDTATGKFLVEPD